jgi:hypothetical protein
MRYTCEHPAFEDAWIEVPDMGWRRSELEQLATFANTPEWWALVQRRVTALHLPTLDGDALTRPEQLTLDDTDRVDFILYQWMLSRLAVGYKDVNKLGNAQWRLSSDTPAETVATKPQTA